MMVAARTLYVVSLLRIRFYVHANISLSAFSTSIWHVRILPVKRDRIQDVSRTCHSQQPEGRTLGPLKAAVTPAKMTTVP
jgi:hypothetical protein